MPHVGIYLSGRPDGGGTHQYTLNVIDGLVPLLDQGWKITAFVVGSDWQRLLPEGFEPVAIDTPFLERAVGAAYKRVDRSAAGLRRSGRFRPSTNAVDRAECDLVIFPAQNPDSYYVRTPSLVTVFDLMHRYAPEFDEYQHGVYAKRERHYASIARYAAGILVDSELGRHQLLESYGGDLEKVYVLPFSPPAYLTSSSEVDITAKYELPSSFLFYPAQFWEHKNHRRLVEAVALVNQRGLEVNLVLTGSPKNAYDNVVRRIAELGTQDHVRILGYVPNEDMYSFYKTAVATAFVSLIGPTNIPPLEAMQVGSPLIVSNAYAMPEQVGDAALLIDPYDVEDIAEKISMVWTNATLREDLVARGRRRVDSWSSSHFGARLRSIVEEMTAAST